MIHRSANDGQADGNIDAAVKSHQLQRDVPLVVIEGNDKIKLTLIHPMEHSVGRNGTRDIETFILGLTNSWRDFLSLADRWGGTASEVRAVIEELVAAVERHLDEVLAKSRLPNEAAEGFKRIVEENVKTLRL